MLVLFFIGLMVFPCRAVWVERSPTGTTPLRAVTFGDEAFVSVGDHGTIVRSTDYGETWTTHDEDAYTRLGVAFGNGTFVSVGQYGYASYSTDNGETWTESSTPISSDMVGAAYGEGTFVVVGSSGNIYHSTTDGVHFSAHPAVAIQWNAIAFGNGIFLTVGNFGMYGYSDDGQIWEGLTNEGSDSFNGITFGNGYFVVVGENGAAYRTADGITWSSITLPSSKEMNAVAFGDDRFVICCTDGTVFESDPGSFTTWSQVDTGESALNAAAFGNHVFTVAGQKSSNPSLYTKGVAAFGIDPKYIPTPAAGGLEEFDVLVPSGFSWSASSSDSWISFDSSVSGINTAAVRYTVEENPDPVSRQAIIEVAGLTHTNFQAANDIATTIYPTQIGYAYYGDTGTVTVAAPPGRAWSASTDDPSMILFTSGMMGTGTASTAYLVTTNQNALARIGRIIISGCADNLVITQQGLNYSIYPTSTNFTYEAASGSFDVTANTGASWTPTTSNSWIHIVSYSGVGSGTVNYTVDQNPSTTSLRTGYVTVQEQVYTITQRRQYVSLVEITPASLNHGSSSGTGRFYVSAEDSVVWLAGESLSWVNLAGDTGLGIYGRGDGSVEYTVDSNTDPSPRSGIVNISGETHTIMQAGAGNSISPESGTYATWSSGTISDDFSVSIGTTWSVSAPDSWITVTFIDTKGSRVFFEVDNNPTWSARYGSVDVTFGGETIQYKILQQPGTYDLDPGSLSVGVDGGNSVIDVINATPSLQWTAQSDVPWITITAGSSGTGNGSVSIHVDATTLYSERNGTVTIGNQTVTVTQAARPLEFSIDPYERRFNESSGASSVQVYGPPGYGWTASESLSWVSLTAGASGTGDGAVSYTVDANTDLGSRSGTITIAGESHAVTQQGILDYYVTPVSQGFTAGGGTLRINVSSSPAYHAWTAASEVQWIEITDSEPPTGSGNGYVDITVHENNNVSNRAGKVWVGSETYSSGAYFEANQSGVPASYSISPAVLNIPGSGDEGHITVSATDGAEWSAGTPPGWIFFGGDSGVGNGSVYYAVEANPTTNARGAVINIAGISCSFNQNAGNDPTGCWADPSRIRENLPAGSIVGTLLPISYLPLESPVFSLQPVSGNNNGFFSISNNNLLVTTVPLDAESVSTYFPGVRVENGSGGSWEGLITVSIENDTMEDADGDGLPEEDEFSQWTDDAVADSDGDGLSDGAETRVTGTDPTNVLSGLWINSVQAGGGMLDLGWNSVSGKLYRVMASDDLPNGITDSVERVSAEGPWTVSSFNTGFHPQRYFQLSMSEPIVQPTGKITAYDGAEDDVFGEKVSIDGDTLVVGAKFDDDNGGNSGSAYVYGRNVGGSNNWGFVAKLTASDGAGGDEFGYWVDLDGDTIVVGAKNDDDLGGNSGSAYVFERNSGGVDNWGEVKKLVASDGGSSDYFGYSVAISGDRIAVGSVWGEAAYLYERDEGGADNWGEVKKLEAVDGEASDYFGCSVDISGDTVAVGAYYDDDRGSNAGAAYLFNRNQGGSGVWGQVKKVYGIGVGDADTFGRYLALDGDTLAVGAPNDDEREPNAGAAYVFERNRGGAENWGETRKIRVMEMSASGNFGWGIDIDGDNLVIGAYNAYNMYDVKGIAYLFQRDLNGTDRWGLLQSCVADDGMTQVSFGWKIAVSGSTIAVGAHGDSEVAGLAGAVQLYEVIDP